LGAVAVQLLARVVQLVLGRRQLRAGAGRVLGGVGRIQFGDDLSGGDGIAQPDLALDDLAVDPERQRGAVARLHFARQRPGRQAFIGLGGHGDHRARRGRRRFIAAAGSEQQSE